MLRDGANLVEPLTPSEVGSPKLCWLSGELTKIRGSPPLKPGVSTFSSYHSPKPGGDG